MRNNAISSFCERYVSNALRKYETTGIKTPITMQELKDRGIM